MKRIKMISVIFILASLLIGGCQYLPDNMQDQVSPTLTSAEIREGDTSTLHLVFSKEMSENIPAEPAGFTVVRNSNTMTIASITKTDLTTYAFTMTENFSQGDVVTVSYSGTPVIKSAGGGILGMFTGQPVIFVSNSSSSSSSSSTNSSSSSTSSAGSTNLVFWNKLGSQNEIENSMVGTDGNLIGSVFYEPGQFDNGVKSLLETNYVMFANANTAADKGTIEFWWKPDFSSTNTTNCEIIKFKNGDYEIQIIHNYCGPCVGPRFQVAVFAPGGVFKSWYVFEPFFSQTNLQHVAISWNGSGTSNSKIMLYIDGLSISGYSTVYDATWTGFPNMDLIIPGNNLNRTSLIDNIKLYNIIKTNFSDRFTE